MRVAACEANTARGDEPAYCAENPRAGRASPAPTIRIEGSKERTHPTQNSRRAGHPKYRLDIREGDRTLVRLLDWKDQSNYICSLEER